MQSSWLFEHSGPTTLCACLDASQPRTQGITFAHPLLRKYGGEQGVSEDNTLGKRLDALMDRAGRAVPHALGTANCMYNHQYES
jgi:hypothetical protein